MMPTGSHPKLDLLFIRMKFAIGVRGYGDFGSSNLLMKDELRLYVRSPELEEENARNQHIERSVIVASLLQGILQALIAALYSGDLQHHRDKIRVILLATPQKQRRYRFTV